MSYFVSLAVNNYKSVKDLPKVRIREFRQNIANYSNYVERTPLSVTRHGKISFIIISPSDLQELIDAIPPSKLIPVELYDVV